MTTPTEAPYRDRSTGLIIFGIAEILIGLLCALFIPMLVASRIFGPHGPDAPPPPPVGPALLIYAVAAIAFIWLGIGSVLARRWARALLLSLSGLALCVGVFACAFLALIMPHMLAAVAQDSHRAMQPSTLRVVKVIIGGFMFVIYILIPGSIFLFYRSPNVKRTCEANDPVERWTDRCPLPVLAVSLLQGFGAIVVLGLMGSYRGFPVFGVMVSGGGSYLLCILIAGLSLYLARGLYRLQIRSWWLALGLMVVTTISNIVTFVGADLGAIYEKMGLDPRAVALAAQVSATPFFKWLIPLSVVPWMIWLLCVRRYFTVQAPPPLTADGPPPPLQA